MKSVKRILTAVTVLLCTVFLAIISIYLLVDDATLVSHLVKRLESSSDIRVLHRGAVHITRTLTPTLTVDDLVITDTGRGYQVKTDSLEVQVSLPKLLLAQLDIPHLLIGDTHIEITENDSPGKPPAPPEPKPGPIHLPLKPVFHDIRISRVEIMHEGGTLILPGSHVRELSLKLDPDNSLKLTGQVELAKQNIDVNGVLRDVDDYFGGQPLGFSFEVQSALFNLSMEGHMDFSQPDASMEATVRGKTPDAEKIVTGIQGIEIPGKLTFESQLKGTFAQLAMEQITAIWHGPDQSKAELKGSIANATKLEGVQLNLTGRLDKPTWLTPLLPESVGALKSARVSARISGAYPMIAVNDLDFQGKTEHDLALTLSGKSDLAHSSTGLAPVNTQAELTFVAPNTRAARCLFFDNIPEFGAVTGRCDVRSAMGDPSLENLTVQTKDGSGIQANLSGEIGKFPLADRPNSGYDLAVSIKATETAVMAGRVGLKLPAFGPLDLGFRIEGSTQALELNEIKFAAGKQDGIRIGVQGHLSFGDWDLADPFKTVDLELQAQSPTTQALSSWIGQELPELGPLSAEARLHTVSGLHRLDPLRIQTVEGGPLTVGLSGSAEHVTLLPELRLREIKLDAQGSTDDTAQLNTVFGLKDGIPSIGPLNAKARISGDDQNLVISDLSMEAGQEDLLRLDLNGRLGEFSAANHWQPQDTRLSVRADSSSSRALAGTLGYRIPELGPLSARADITGKDKKVSMDSAQLQLGDKDNPVVTGTGYIHDLYGMKGIKGDAQLHLDGRRLAAFADLDKLPELGAVTGRLSISDSDGSLGMDSLQVETGESKLLNLKLDGRFDNFKDPATLLLNSRLAARDLQLIGALFEREWPAVGPVQLDVEIRRTSKGNELNSTLTAGETEVQTKLNALFEKTPAQISGTVTARNMLAWNLLEKARKEKAEKKEPSSKEPVFSREPIPFQRLKKVDLDIAIEVESFDQESYLAESARFQLTLKSGLLSISPAYLLFPKGKVDIDLELDTRDHPRLSFKAFCENLDPNRALDIRETNKAFEAQMDMDVSFSTSGLTPHELAANSQGSIYITVEDGRIPAAPIDLVFVDLAGWAWKKATKERFYNIDCWVADYSIDQGVISTKAFIIDGKEIAITGTGTVDLDREEVEYILLPKKKSSLIYHADPVKINGPLNDPKVKVLPLKSAATSIAQIGGIIFAPYIFLPLTAADHLAGNLGGEDGKSPCLEYRKTRIIENKSQESMNQSWGGEPGAGDKAQGGIDQ